MAGRLACPDKRFAKWPKAVGVQCGTLDGDEKDDMLAELDAVVAHLYGLSEPQLTHIFETFHEGWDFQPRLRAVLKHYKAWAGKALGEVDETPSGQGRSMATAIRWPASRNWQVLRR